MDRPPIAEGPRRRLGFQFAVNLTTTPFSAASVWAGALASLLVSAAQTVLTTAGNVVLYEYAGGPIDEAIGSRGAVARA